MRAATLTDVLESIGATTLSPWVVPRSKATAELTDVVIYDRLDPEHIDAGALVLAVGLDVDETADLLGYAAERGAQAVITRGQRSELTLLVDRARAHDIALLGMAQGVGWAGMASLLRNAVSRVGGHIAHGDSSLAHQDLNSVANTLASAVNGSVLIFSPQQEILAFSRLRPDDDLLRQQAVRDQHGPQAYRDHLRERGIYRQLWSSDEVVSIPPVEQFSAGRRLAVAIRAGEEILGSIWVAEGAEQPLVEDAKEVLRGAAAAASGHLVWLQARAQTQRRFTEGLVAQLVSGNADTLAVASWLGVQADRPCVCLILSIGDTSSRRRLADLAVMHFSAFRYSVLTSISRGFVEVVLCDLPEGWVALPAARDMVARIGKSLDDPVLAAVGTTEPTLAALPVSHRRADAVLRVLRRSAVTGEGRVASYQEIRTEVQVELLHRVIADDAELASGHAEVLSSWDREHGTEYAASVLVLLEHFGNVRAAAERAHVHPNTLRYRVRRACELSGLDLEEPSQRLMAQLQLGSHRLSDPT